MILRLIVIESERAGGRIERRIELGDEGEEEGFDGDTGTNDEHKGVIVTKGNQIFIQNILILSLTDFCFIEIQKEKLRRSVASRRLFPRVVDGLIWPLHSLSDEGVDVERMCRINFRMRKLQNCRSLRHLLRFRDNHLTIILAINATGDSVLAGGEHVVLEVAKRAGGASEGCGEGEE